MKTKAKSKVKTFKNKLTNLVCSAVQSSCATTHVALSYATDSVEWVEGKLVKRLIGVPEKATVIDRRHVTLKNKHAVAQTLSEFSKAVKSYVKTKVDVADAMIVNETIH